MRGPGGARWRRQLRLLSVGRGPLRRTSDRVEALVRVLCLLVLVAAVPLSVAVGVHVDRQAGALAQTHAGSAVQVEGVVDGPVHQLVTGPVARTEIAPTSWTGRDGLRHTAEVAVPRGSRPGSTVQVWVSTRSGEPVPDPREVDPVMLGGLASVGVALATAVLAGAFRSAAGWIIGLHHSRSWCRDWERADRAWGPPRA